MTTCTQIVHIEGLSFGKGQRVEDLRIVNPSLSEEELKLRLDEAVKARQLERYTLADDVYYMKSL